MDDLAVLHPALQTCLQHLHPAVAQAKADLNPMGTPSSPAPAALLSVVAPAPPQGAPLSAAGTLQDNLRGMQAGIWGAALPAAAGALLDMATVSSELAASTLCERSRRATAAGDSTV